MGHYSIKAITLACRQCNWFSRVPTWVGCVWRPSDGLEKDTFPLLTGNQSIPVHVSLFSPSFCPLTWPETVSISCLFFLLNFFPEDALQKHSFWYSKFAVLIMLLIYQTLCMAPLYLSYLNSVENAHFPQITGTPLIKFPSKGKGISSAGLALCLRKSCFPGDSFNLLQKVRKLNQLLCLLVHLPLYSSYPKPTNLLALFIMYDTSF